MRIAVLAFATIFPFAAVAADNVAIWDFNLDPHWEGTNNVPRPEACKTTIQDFGYSATDYNGTKGEIGGEITRSLTPAKYLKAIPKKTLNDHLHASGTFVVPACSGSAGVLVGWFNATSNGWRTPNSLAFRIDSDGGRYRIFFEYGTQTWKTGGGATFQEPYQQHRDDVILAGPKPHAWALDYDPHGDGEITFTLDGKEYRKALEPGHKDEGAVFDRFGILNVQSSGDSMRFYLANLNIDGEAQDFSLDPKWEETGNHVTFNDCGVRPVHDFGWRTTAHAGGAPGEIGGRIWRIEQDTPQDSCAYGTPTAPLDLNTPLIASGKIAFTAAVSDSAVVFGWYNAASLPGGPPANCLGVMIEGPSAVGHYFRPVMVAANGKGQWPDSGPLIRPDNTPHTWRIEYHPASAERPANIVAALDFETVTFPVTEVMVREGALFDHFGVFSWLRGGHFVEIYLDDLSFTAGR